MRNLAVAFAAITITSLFGQSSSAYRITQTYPLGGDGSWDYVVPDPPNHRVFVARHRESIILRGIAGQYRSRNR